MFFLLACASPFGTTPGLTDLACTAEVDAEVRTVINVSWAPPGAGSSWVEFGPTSQYGLVTPTTEGPDPVAQPLVGQGPSEDVYWRATSDVDGVAHTCSGVSTTGVLPPEFPAFEVTLDDESLRSPEPYLLGAFFAPVAVNPFVGILDREGSVVWYQVGDVDTIAVDVHYARDGSGIYFNQFSGNLQLDGSQIRKVSLGGETLSETDTPRAHHMFLELEGGALAYQQLDTRSYYDASTGVTSEWDGDAIAVVSPEGAAETVFSVWDWLTPAWNDHMDGIGMYGGVDWTHGNAIKLDGDDLLLSLAHTAEVLRIDGTSMAVEEVFHGTEANPPFDYQHDPTVLGDGNLLIFMTTQSASGAIEYAPRVELTEVWRYGFHDIAPALGQAIRLDNGNTLVNFGTRGRMDEVTPEGEVAWQIETELGAGFGQFGLLTELYPGN